MMSMRMGEAITPTAAVKQLFQQKQVRNILIMRMRKAITQTAAVKQLHIPAKAGKEYSDNEDEESHYSDSSSKTTIPAKAGNDYSDNEDEGITQTTAVKQLFWRKRARIILMMRMKELKMTAVKQLF